MGTRDPAAAPRTAPTDWQVGGEVPAVDLRALRLDLASWAGQAGATTEQVEDLTAAVYEAMANVADHAYASGNGPLEVRARRSAGGLEVTVTDRGAWSPEPEDPGHRGRGLVLIRGLADEAEVQKTPAGTVVRMRWHLAL